jgi:hypothetical protein
LSYEKVRSGDSLKGFDAKYSSEMGWQIVADDLANDVIKRLMDGQAINTVSRALGISNDRVSNIKRQAEESQMVVFPVNKSGAGGNKAKAKKGSEKGGQDE